MKEQWHTQSIRVPMHVHQAIKERAIKERRSYNMMVAVLLEETVSTIKQQSSNKPKPKLPGNWEAEFERLWIAKGRKGSKKKAREIWQRMAAGENEQDTTSFVDMICRHMEDSADEIGFTDLHLTTYLNQERWQQ
jgi:hypothetical protein